jgi:SRSO17 transposase
LLPGAAAEALHAPDGFQRLLNSSVWDADALRDDVRAYVAERLGPGGVLIIDDTGFVKKGTTSAGVGAVHRRLGKDRQLPDRGVRRLCHQLGPVPGGPGALPAQSLDVSDRDRCRAARIPDARGFATKGELARDIGRRCVAVGLPAAW